MIVMNFCFNATRGARIEFHLHMHTIDIVRATYKLQKANAVAPKLYISFRLGKSTTYTHTQYIKKIYM